MSRLREDRPGSNPVIDRLLAGAGITGRGLTSAPIGPDGASQLDELSTTAWADVHRTGLRIAGALQAAGVRPGDAVAVLAGAPGEIAPLVQGIWFSGASVTMLHQPTHRSDMRLWVEDTGRALAAVGSSTVVVGDPFMAAASQFGAVAAQVLEMSALLDGPPGEIVQSDQDAIAFLQLTSGSTGTPKAVSISYRNIEANLRAMVSASGADPETDVVVSWLPLFHDMGMMGFLIVPMCRAMSTVSVTPMDFLGDPLLWAKLISTYRGSMTAGPNFAYSLLARRLRKAPDGAYDLSSLQFALSGAEAIDVATLERFVAEGARFGMRADAVVPAYGMAEATLAVSFVRRGEGYRVCPPHPDLVAAQGTQASARVPLGLPLPGCEVRVVTEDRQVLAPESIGEARSAVTTSPRDTARHPDSSRCSMRKAGSPPATSAISPRTASP